MLINQETIRRFVPRSMIPAYRKVKFKINRRKYFGDKYYCNVCDSYLKEWIHAGPVDHCNFMCPVCYSYGRHRMMVRVLENELLQYSFNLGKTMLHFAPEMGTQNWLKRNLPQFKYQSADLFSQDVDLHLDLQNIALQNETIDVAILSHVLEHVDDDVQALRELNRIITSGGYLFVQVPMSGMLKTIDDKFDSVTARMLHYGKTDHVRLYGADIENRLVDAGFDVTVHIARNDPYRSLFSYMALDLPDDSTMLYDNESTTFVCRKLA